MLDRRAKLSQPGIPSNDGQPCPVLLRVQLAHHQARQQCQSWERFLKMVGLQRMRSGCWGKRVQPLQAGRLTPQQPDQGRLPMMVLEPRLCPMAPTHQLGTPAAWSAQELMLDRRAKLKREPGLSNGW